MNLKEQIQAELKSAMRERNEIAKNTLKGVLAAFVNELVASGRTPRDELTDAESLKVLKRLEKQRKDAIEKYSQGGRADLVEVEGAELAVLAKFLPEKMSAEKILEIAKQKKEELGIEEIGKVGVLIGAVIKETAGEADGAEVQKIVKSLFE